ncbi:hypothetical protein C8Q80DRAFT_1107396 [Daedaleopsis nitida]|nr:hypothetical protein C8Q80DRAFT_1107396 [Daedaleopsis nitida]
MLAQLDEIHWTIADFLYTLFRTRTEQGGPRAAAVARDKHLETSLSHFLCGRTSHTPIEIIQLWHDHPFSYPATTAEHSEALYSFDKPYLEVKHARAAITSMAVQLCERRMLEEVRQAVRGLSMVGRILERHQPLALRLLTSIATPRARSDSKYPAAERQQRPPRLVAIEALSTLDFSHTSHARLLPAARSIMHFACSASHVLWRSGSRTGHTQSWSTTYGMLRDLAKQDAAEIVKLGQDETKWIVGRADNVQQHHKQRERRIGRENVMRVGVAGTVAEVEDFVQEAADLDDKVHRINAGVRKNLTVEKLFDMVDFAHLAEVAALQWLQTLVNHVPSLACYKRDLISAYNTEGDGAKLKIPTRRTRIHPLAPVAKNEAVTTELRDTMVEFLGQLGQHEDSYMRRVILFGGDGLTFENLIKLKNYLRAAPETSEFQRLELVTPFLETWHTELTFLTAIYQTHFESSLTPDPSKLGHSSTKIDQKAPANLKKVDYYKDCWTAYKVLDVRQLDCWRLHFSCDDLEEYFSGLQRAQKQIPTFYDLRKIARTLNRMYATTHAAEDALRGKTQRRAWRHGSPWVPPSTQLTSSTDTVTSKSAADKGTRTPSTRTQLASTVKPVKRATMPIPQDAPFEGDRVLAQSILLMRDTIMSRAMAEAVTRGDIGTVYECMKWMMFCFEGSGHHSKYTGYVLEMICNLELESSPALRDVFLRNWLVNPSGEANGHQEGDLMQEHYNRILEEFIERRSMEWDDPFLREVVAPNVHHLTALKNAWGTGQGLAERRGKHPEPHSRPEVRILLGEYNRSELHSFRRGRTFPQSSHTKDMFSVGVGNLQDGKLSRWIFNSLRAQEGGSNSLHAEDDEPDDEEPEDGDSEYPEGTSRWLATRGQRHLIDGELVFEIETETLGTQWEEIGEDAAGAYDSEEDAEL